MSMLIILFREGGQLQMCIFARLNCKVFLGLSLVQRNKALPREVDFKDILKWAYETPTVLD